MWEYRLELIHMGKSIPRYCQLFSGTEEGKLKAEAWLKTNCLLEGGSFTGNPENFKRNTDRGYPTPKADRTFWGIFYEEFRENDFGLEIP